MASGQWTLAHTYFFRQLPFEKGSLPGTGSYPAQQRPLLLAFGADLDDLALPGLPPLVLAAFALVAILPIRKCRRVWTLRGPSLLCGRACGRVPPSMSAPFHALSSLTESVKVNSMRLEQREGRFFWLKRRRPLAGPILRGANLFFALAQAPLRAVLPVCAWQRWEIECFIGLHGAEGFAAFAEGTDGMGAEALPGRGLTEPLDDGTLTPAMAAAAGRELRRAHAWHSPRLGAAWSHGDAHAGNFVLDDQTGRARLIDFELTHLPTLSPDERHADDLAGFLLDLVGRISEEKWLPCATAFLSGYGRREIIARLLESLRLPRRTVALAWLWRMVRTGFLLGDIYRRRISALLESETFSSNESPIVDDPVALVGPTALLAEPSGLVASTQSLTGVPPSRCS